MDGVRIAAGWVRELQGRWLGSIGVDWRSADGLQSPHRAPMALCGSCDARDGERILSRELSRTGVARVCGEVGSVAGWQSGGEWNGSQSGHGASELGFPRPMPGKMQGKAARRAGDPSHQSEEPPPEGFGGRDPFTQADAGCPAGQVVRHHLYRQPGAVGGEAPRGHVVQPDAVLEVAYRILDLGVAAMISLQFEGLPVPVGDEAVIAVSGEEGELGTGCRLHPPDNEPHRRGVGLGLEGSIELVSEVQDYNDIRIMGAIEDKIMLSTSNLPQMDAVLITIFVLPNTSEPTFPIWLNIPLSKSSAFFEPLSICETLAVGMAIITP